MSFQLKPMKTAAPLEREDQRAFFQYLWTLKYDGDRIWEYAFAIPNGTYLHGSISQRVAQSNALKHQGVRNGVPDVFIPIPVAPYAGLFIELKRPPNKPSDDQKLWHERLRRRGYDVRVTYNLDQCIAATREYFSL